METSQRIEQWEKMVQEVPDGMSWFSLGNAYKDAERPEDAVNAYRKALGYDEKLSRAYQSLGQVLIQLGREDEAAEVLTKGYTLAAGQGDVMPQRAMGSLLEKIGKPVPQAEKPAAPDAAQLGENQLIDRRTGRPGARMPDPPMRGPLGKFIFDHYTQETWREWIGQGTKVINELRLDFSREDHQKVYDQQMMEWLGISQAEVDEHAGK